jgi:UDP-2,3-diacylglucosamine hydrolase
LPAADGPASALPGGLAMIRVRQGETALFVSDTHLSDAQPETGAAFLAALDRHAPGVTHLFLLGDLFDAWVGDDVLADSDCETIATALVARLAALAAGGTTVHYLHGNRDFLLGVAPSPAPLGTAAQACTGFEARSGARRLPDPCILELHGRRTVLAHGDTLCTDDTDYLAFRAQARSPAWQAAFLARPLAERLAAARAMRNQSTRSKLDKPMALMDATEDAVLALLRETDAELLIHGHTHRPARHEHRLGARVAQRWVLPDWDAAGSRGGLLLAREGGLLPLGAWPASPAG